MSAISYARIARNANPAAILLGIKSRLVLVIFNSLSKNAKTTGIASDAKAVIINNIESGDLMLMLPISLLNVKQSESVEKIIAPNVVASIIGK